MVRVTREARYRLTVRHGAKVSRDEFDDLDAALAGLRRRAEEVRDGEPLPAVSMLRKFGPAERVAARLEISTGGWLRGSDGGVDVMGDGKLIAFAGGIRRRTLEPRGEESPFDALRRELGG